MVSSPVNVATSFPLSGSPLLHTPNTLTIKGAQFKHTMLTLDYYLENDWSSNKFSNGSPIIATWGYPPNNLKSFYGYVHHIIPSHGESNYAVKVQCIGATYPLKDVAATSMPSATVLQAAALTLQKNMFDLIVDSNGTMWPSLTRTAHETFWQYLVRLAQKIGCTMYGDNTAVYMYDPTDVLIANAQSYPVLNFQAGTGNERQNLVSFNPILGDDGTGALTSKEYLTQGVDALTGQIFSASGSTLPTKTLAGVSIPAHWPEYLKGEPSENPQIAQSTVTGMARKNRWINSANAYAIGSPRVTPGSGVIVRGVSLASDGLWFVAEAEHVVSNDGHPNYWNYFMNLKLLRDSKHQQATVAPSARPTRRILSITDVQSNRKPSPPILVNGVWVSRQPRLTRVAV